MSFWLSHDTSVADLRYVQNINDKPTDVSCMLLNKNNRHTTTVLIQNFIHQMVGQKVNNKTEKKQKQSITLAYWLIPGCLSQSGPDIFMGLVSMHWMFMHTTNNDQHNVAVKVI